MECARSKELLSDYNDGIVDAQTKALLEEHLRTCGDCRQDLASLKALVQEVGSLESIGAPRDFLQKVHERIERRSRFGEIMRTLFVPLRIKVPLELATAAAVAILVFAVYTIQQPRKQEIAHIPLDADRLMSAKEAKVETARPIVKKKGYKSTPSLKGAAAEPSERQGEVIELALLLKTEAFGRAYAPCAAKELAPGAPKRAGTIDEEKIDVSSRAKTVTGRQAVPTAETEPCELKEEKRAVTSPIRAREALTDEANVPFSYGDETLSRVKNLVDRAEGRVVSIEYEKQTEKPQSIHAEIPAKHYHAFCDGLTQIAPLQTTPPTAPEKEQEVIQIRIRLIH